MAPKKSTGSKPASEKKAAETTKNPLFESRKRNFGIGQHIQPQRDVTRFVRWPKYILLQRKKRILLSRLKVPPTINQFNKVLDKPSATSLFKLLHKYRPEDTQTKKKRLFETAKKSEESKQEKKEAPKKALALTYGLNAVTTAIEKKKAKLVVIAHDIDPIELVVWLPTLCRKMEVPYVIVKSKARLGALVHRKTTSTLAITNVNKEDVKDLATFVGLAMDTFNKNPDVRRQWGGLQLGPKSAAALRKRERAVAKERITVA